MNNATVSSLPSTAPIVATAVSAGAAQRGSPADDRSITQEGLTSSVGQGLDRVELAASPLFDSSRYADPHIA